MKDEKINSNECKASEGAIKRASSVIVLRAMKKIKKTAFISLIIILCLAIHHQECFSDNWVHILTRKTPGKLYGVKNYIDVDRIKVDKFKGEIEIYGKTIYIDESYDVNHILIYYKEKLYSFLSSKKYKAKGRLKYHLRGRQLKRITKVKYEPDSLIQKSVDFVMKNINLGSETVAIAGVSEDLLLASNLGEVPAVKRFLAEGADINAKGKHGMTALMEASAKGHLEVVQVLLDHGAEVNAVGKNGITALIAASWGGHRKVVEALLAKGAEVGQTALFHASDKGHRGVVQALLAKGAYVNAWDEHGQTALFAASEKGHRGVVQALLDKGAEVNVKRKDGVTALMLASVNGHREIVEDLLAKGAEVNAKDKWGNTALTRASKKGHQEIKQMLIEAGAK